MEWLDGELVATWINIRQMPHSTLPEEPTIPHGYPVDMYCITIYIVTLTLQYALHLSVLLICLIMNHMKI